MCIYIYIYVIVIIPLCRYLKDMLWESANIICM